MDKNIINICVLCVPNYYSEMVKFFTNYSPHPVSKYFNGKVTKNQYYETVMGKIEKLVELLNELKNKGFTGFIRINFSQGGITKIEKNEEILKKTHPQR